MLNLLRVLQWLEAATHSKRQLGNGVAVLLWIPVGTPVKHLMSNVGGQVRNPLLDERNTRCITQLAMRLKHNAKKEPSAALVKELDPWATLNPQTGEAFTD